MELLCEICDRERFVNEFERNNYLATLRKRNDESLYDDYTIKNVDLDEVEKLLNDYVTRHKRNF